MAALLFSQGACRAPARGILTPPSSRRTWQRPQQARRLLTSTPAAAAGQPGQGGSGDASSGSGSPSSGLSKSEQAKRQRRQGNRWIGFEPDPQPQLQAWLQQEQGLSEEEADSHARRLVFVFEGNEAAALASLPATFAFCRGKGLNGLETAQLLGRIGKRQPAKAVNFASTVQRDWELIDGCIEAYLRQVEEAKARWPKHGSLASVLRSSANAARALSTPPGHVAAWLRQAGERLSQEQLGKLLLSYPAVVTSKPATALAAMDFAGSELGAGDVAAFVSKNRGVLMCDAATLQHNLDSLQRAMGLTAEQARHLAAEQPTLLCSKPETVQGAAGWLQQRFPAPEQLQAVVQRGPQLLIKSAEWLQRQAHSLQQRLGWDSERVTRYISGYPQPFATVDLSKPDTAAKLLLLTRVVGVLSEQECIENHSTYLKTNLEVMAAHYMLVQELAPHLLVRPDGSPALRWIADAKRLLVEKGKLLSLADYRKHVADWPESEEGRRLLAALRRGSTEGWPLPPAELAEQRRLQWEAGAAVRASKQGTTAGKRQRRGAGRRRQGGAGRGDGDGSGGED